MLRLSPDVTFPSWGAAQLENRGWRHVTALNHHAVTDRHGQAAPPGPLGSVESLPEPSSLQGDECTKLFRSFCKSFPRIGAHFGTNL